MVREGIVLGHLVSSKGLEVDKAKVKVIQDLTLPKSIRELRSFLGHVDFYCHFIKDFAASNISSKLMFQYLLVILLQSLAFMQGKRFHH